MLEKLCNKCNCVKSLTEFYPDKTHGDGVHSTCKKCTNAYSKQYREQNAERMTEYKRNLKRNNPVKYLLIGAKARCKREGIPFDIEAGDLDHPTHCPVLNIELDYTSSQSKRGMVASNAATLDRIIPELGYVRGNVVILSWRANKLKSDITLSEMSAFSKYYAQLVSESIDCSL